MQECLQHISIASLKQGVLQGAWKTANITPMYKKGEKRSHAIIDMLH